MKKFVVKLSWSRMAIGSILVAAIACMVACGDDSSSSSGPNDEPVSEERSSSSKKLSSSSVIASEAKQSGSSSVIARTSCNVDADENCMKDSRDGQTYKTVSIGMQTWMAENLNYAYIEVPYNSGYNTSDSTSWCVDNNLSNCTKYGRLYTWAAAMDSVVTWATNGKGCGYDKKCSPTYPVRGVCPEGWHLPTRAEWDVLFTAVGCSWTACENLKSSSDWNGTDTYAFSALPAGDRDYGGNYNNMGNNANFWSSSEYSSGSAYIVFFYNDDFGALLTYGLKGRAFSVRCVKN